MANQSHSLIHGRLLTKQIWAVGGGKGGVGKSLISSSLAYCLAKQGHSTVAIDLDLGGANLHTVLGQPPPRKCISDFLTGSTDHLEECLVQTEFANLNLIGGAKDDLRITQASAERIRLLKDAIRNLKAEFVILDLGAGTSPHTIDFFNLSDVRIVTTLPEPTSIENAYRFLKTAYYQNFLDRPELASIRPLVESAMTPDGKSGIRSPQQLLIEAGKIDPVVADRLKAAIQAWRVALVLNQSRSQMDIDIGLSMKSVAKKYFGIELDYLGYIEYEPNVWQSVRKMRPILAEFPGSRVATHMERIVNYLLKRPNIGNTLGQKTHAFE
jgi:flagellar biosynthesis protein FlhG